MGMKVLGISRGWDWGYCSLGRVLRVRIRVSGVGLGGQVGDLGSPCLGEGVQPRAAAVWGLSLGGLRGAELCVP